jgi:formate dehydrogenase major subunit
VGGIEGLAGDDPFIMQADGKGWLYAPTGLLDGPMPAHYEPAESPVRNQFYRQQASPTRQVFKRKDNLQNPSPPETGADVYPFVFTTYRLTEHHTAGGMSRWLPYLSELQPEFFCEVSPELARERELQHLGWATIVTARTAIEARVLVTDRMMPLRIGDQIVHQVGLPYHWGVGTNALVSGDSANDLFGVTLDPNVHIQESKVASCDIVAGRRPTGPGLLRFVEEYRSRAGSTTETGNTRLTPEES